MKGKNGKNGSSSKTPEEQQNPQRVEASTQRPPSPTPRPPTPRPHPPPSQGGPSWGGPLGGVGGMPPINMHAIPVGGSAGSATGSVGGIATDAASRKRARGSNERSNAAGGDRNRLPFECTTCRKDFPTDKSLFGHMRTHRSRAWKGAFPPPTFSREEFADTGLLNPEGGEEEQEVDPVIPQQATPPAVEEAVQEAIGDLNVAQPEVLESEVQYCVPDLNRSPPGEENGSGNNSDNN